MLIDAHFSKFCLESNLLDKVRRLQEQIKADRQVVHQLESQLRGPLMAYIEPPKLTKSKAGGRWKNLVDEIQNGVGQYAVEAWVIKVK